LEKNLNFYGVCLLNTNTMATESDIAQILANTIQNLKSESWNKIENEDKVCDKVSNNKYDDEREMEKVRKLFDSIPVDTPCESEHKIQEEPEYIYKKYLDDIGIPDITDEAHKIVASVKNLSFDPWKLIGKYDINAHQINSFNVYMEKIPDLFRSFFPLEIKQKKSGDCSRIEICNIIIEEPRCNSRPLLPIEARLRNLTYSVKVFANIKVYSLDNRLIQFENHAEIAQIPIMLGSKYCNIKDPIKSGECPYDSFGYFIVNGVERIIVAQERMASDNVQILKPSVQGEGKKYAFVAKCYSNISDGDRPGMLKVKIEHSGINTHAFFTPFISIGVPAGLLLQYFDNYKDPIEDKDNVEEEEYQDYIQRRNERLFKFICPEDNPDIRLAKHARILTSETPVDIELVEVLVEHLKSIPDKKHKNSPEDTVKEILEHEILAHNVRRENRVFYYGLMLRKLIMTWMKKRLPTDRDSFISKRIDTTGKLFLDLTRGALKTYISEMIESQSKQITLREFTRNTSIATRIENAMKTGKWMVTKTPGRGGLFLRDGVSQLYNRYNRICALSFLRKISAGGTKNTGAIGIQDTHLLHNSQFGTIDPCETPEGKSAGLIKNLAILGTFTPYIESAQVRSLLISFTRPVTYENHKLTHVFLNGELIGVTDSGVKFRRALINARKKLQIHPMTSIAYDWDDNQIIVSTDGGRLTRPVLTVSVKNGKAFLPIKDCQTWNEYLQKGYVQFLDTTEEEWSLVAMDESEITTKHQYCEVHQSILLGVCAGVIPLPDHSQSPRNCYGSAMLKQSAGIPVSNQHLRFDTSATILTHPHKPLTQTKTAERLGFSKLPAGQNVILAVAMYTGFNVEDSLIVNRDFVDKGGLEVTVEHEVQYEETNQGNTFITTIEVPSKELREKARSYDYSKLDKNGVIKKGSIVTKNTVIIAVTFRGNGKNSESVAIPEIHHLEEPFKVIDVLITTSKKKLVKVKLATVRKVQTGDKLASICAQKGIVGRVMNPEDMPQIVTPGPNFGLIPHVIINPCAFPSRMTINLPMELLIGTVASYRGGQGDCSSFTKIDINALGDEMVKRGLPRFAKYDMINGMTGELLEAKIYCGPTYYQRLKHMIMEKMSVRDTGIVVNLTRQPANAGRKNGYGLSSIRFGTMESQCTWAHGCPFTSVERMCTSSDEYTAWVCKKCKMIANSHKCCGDTVKHKFPYILKLIMRICLSMGVKPGINVI
jgi:DNA-directed RNA polymerase II subunit RPB2